MTDFFEDLQHDIDDALDFILCATREEWDETDLLDEYVPVEP